MSVLPLPPRASAPARVTRPAPAPAPGRTLRVPLIHQGWTWACGPTALAMVMGYWGRPVAREAIDRDIRRTNLREMPTAPDAIAAWARRHGLRAEVSAGRSLEHLARQVDQGAPPLVLYDPPTRDGWIDRHDAVWHYVVVTGYRRGPDGRVAALTIADPADGRAHEVPAPRFEAAWSRLALLGHGVGVDRLMIALAPARAPLDLARGRCDELAWWRSLPARGLLAAGLAAWRGLDRLLTLGR